MNMHETFLDVNCPTTLARYTDSDFKSRQMLARFYLSLNMANMRVVFGERHSAKKNMEREEKIKCHS